MLDCQEAKRWLKQAKYTIESIRVDINGGFHSWACFKAHQAAELSLSKQSYVQLVSSLSAMIFSASGVELLGYALALRARRIV